MKHPRFATLVGLLFALAASWSSIALAAEGVGAGPGSREIEFRSDDPQGQRIARKVLAKEIAYDEASPGSHLLSTAWVNLSDPKSPTLLVMYACSATGNCGLSGFERGKRGWRLVLDSNAQSCAILPSSHGGRRDLSASMHGSATESAIKTYWWRGNRYVRVSVREHMSVR